MKLRFIHILLLVLVLAAVVPAVADVQIKTPGTVCPGPDSTVFWEQASLCPQDTLLWQRPAFQFGPSTSQTCDSSLAGMVQWTATAASPNNTLQYCNGSGWTNFASTSSGILLGASATATNPQRTGDAGTGLFSATASTVSIATAGVEAMRITATGLGIGTQSPSASFQVANVGSFDPWGWPQNTIGIGVVNHGINFGNSILFSNVNHGNHIGLIYWNNDMLYIDQISGSGGVQHNNLLTLNSTGLGVNISGSYPSSALSVGGGISAGSWASTISAPSNGIIVSGRVGFATATPLSALDVNGGVAIGSYAGTATAPSNALIVSGNVGIGTATPRTSLDIGYNTDALVLQSGTTGQRPASPVGGMMRYNTTANTVEFYQNGGWVYPVWSSDARLKTHIAPVKNALDIVTGMRPVFFDWDRDNPKASGMDDRRHIGFLAQELEDVLPEVVNVGADTYRTVEYGPIVAVAVGAVKEVNAKVDSLAVRNNRLAQDIDDLKALNDELRELREKVERLSKSCGANSGQ